MGAWLALNAGLEPTALLVPYAWMTVSTYEIGAPRNKAGTLEPETGFRRLDSALVNILNAHVDAQKSVCWKSA